MAQHKLRTIHYKPLMDFIKEATLKGGLDYRELKEYVSREYQHKYPYRIISKLVEAGFIIKEQKTIIKFVKDLPSGNRGKNDSTK